MTKSPGKSGHHFWKVLYQPADFFRELREASGWLTPFSVLTLAHTANGVVAFLASRQESLLPLPVSPLIVVMVLFILIVLRNLLLCTTVSFFLLHLFKFFLPLTSGSVNFRYFFAVIVSCNLVFALEAALSIVAGQVVWLSGLSQSFKPIEAIALSSVGFSSAPMPITLLLQKITPFSFWYFWALVHGIRNFTGTRKGFGVVLLTWLFDLFLRVSLPRIFQVGLNSVRTWAG